MEATVEQIQRLEQGIASFSSQRQILSSQQVELDTALSELHRAQGTVYRIVGSLMVVAEKGELTTELTAQKETVAVRLSALEKQEQSLREKTLELQRKLSEESQHAK